MKIRITVSLFAFVAMFAAMPVTIYAKNEGMTSTQVNRVYQSVIVGENASGEFTQQWVVEDIAEEEMVTIEIIGENADKISLSTNEFRFTPSRQWLRLRFEVEDSMPSDTYEITLQIRGEDGVVKPLKLDILLSVTRYANPENGNVTVSRPEGSVFFDNFFYIFFLFPLVGFLIRIPALVSIWKKVKELMSSAKRPPIGISRQSPSMPSSPIKHGGSSPAKSGGPIIRN